MVDFDNETTVAQPAVDVCRILILQSRHHLKEAMGAAKKVILRDGAAELFDVKSRLYEFYLETCAGMSRSKPHKEDYEQLKNIINKEKESLTFEDIEEGYLCINKWLDDIGLTKVDTKKKLGGDLASRNKANGWKS